MVFIKSIAIAATAAILAVPTLASPANLEARQNGVTCQTSSGSPSVSSVNDAIAAVKKRKECNQTNGHGSDCSTLVSTKGGKIGICGGKESSISCATIAGYAQEVLNDCQSGGKVGGTFTINASDRVIVF